MGYKIYRKCDEIPLCKFIDMYNGDLSALIIEGRPDEKELKDVSIQLIEEYNGIIGNKSLVYIVNNQSRMIDYNLKLIILEAAKNMINSRHFNDASIILNSLGVSFNEYVSDEDIQSINKKIDSIRGETMLRLELLKRGNEARSNIKSEGPNFTKERVIVSTHFKMYIDVNKITASEYGYMAKLMIDELKNIKHYGK